MEAAKKQKCSIAGTLRLASDQRCNNICCSTRGEAAIQEKGRMFMFSVTDTLPPDRLRERGESQAQNETRSSVSLSCRLAVATSQEVFEVT